MDRAKLIQEKIQREKALLTGARAMYSASGGNPAVQQQCEANIRDAQRNIKYLTEKLDALSVPAKQQKEPVNVTPFELLKYNTPFLGHRIQLMLQQLDYKLSLEKEYKRGIEKLERLYMADGDNDAAFKASTNLKYSTAKLGLLQYALKRYKDIQLDFDEQVEVQENVRSPVSGKLHLQISSIDGVDHSTLSLQKNVETQINVKVENKDAARTVGRGDIFNSDLHIPLEKANEIEILATDVADDFSKPVAIMWLRLADVLEAIRRQRNQQSDIAAGFTTSEKISPIRQADVVEGWFSLEPTGRVYLRLRIELNDQYKDKNRDGVGRQKAIVEKHEHVTDILGHQFVHQNFYSVTSCSICHDFMTFPTQCLECRMAVHKTCMHKIVTRCRATRPHPDDKLDLVKHHIPHKWVLTDNKAATWCSHCGTMLPLGKKQIQECSECQVQCHPKCSKYVPDLCGMTMEMAAQVVSAIRMANLQKEAKERSSTIDSLTSEISVAKRGDHKPTITPVVPSWSSDAKVSPGSPYVGGKVTRNLANLSHPSQGSRVGSAPRKPVPRKQVPSGQSSQQSTPVQQTQSPGSHQSYQHSPWTPATPGNSSTARFPTFNDISKIQSAPTFPEIDDFDLPPKYSDPTSSTPDLATRPPAPLPPVPTKASPPVPPTPRKVDNKLDPTHQTSATLSSAAPSWQSRIDTTATSFTSSTSTGDYRPPVHPLRPQQPVPAKQPNVAAAQAAAAALMGASAQQKLQPPAAPRTRERKPSFTNPQISQNDFEMLSVLGRGCFGKVMLARSKQSKQLYAIKALKKQTLIEDNDVEGCRAEKDVFMVASQANHPFLLNLHACFQSASRMFFVMDFVGGGDLIYHLQTRKLNRKEIQFYIAEILLALKYFHDKEIIYRDLKLENILLTVDGHIKLADYGLCKMGMGHGRTTGTMCGTPHFMAPEIVKKQIHGRRRYTRSIDWWSLGVLMYLMCFMRQPFRGEDDEAIYNSIRFDNPVYPPSHPFETSLIRKLLDKDPERRLGSSERDALEIMEHPYFDSIDFGSLLALKVKVPFKPLVTSSTDLKYFDSEFTDEPAMLTPMNSVLTQEDQDKFEGFSWSGNHAV